MANAEDYVKYLSIPPARMHAIGQDFAADRPPGPSYTALERECYDSMKADFDKFKADNPGAKPIFHLPFDAGAD